MDPQPQSPGPPTRRQLLWAGAALALLLLIGAVLIGYRYDITLWDWIKLLVVPAVIAGGGFWFSRQQRERELQSSELRTEGDRKIAQERAETERAIADQQKQDDTLQAYLDQMGQLMLDKDRRLRSEDRKGDDVRTLARARTLTVLQRLDGERKANVLRFLYESRLVGKDDVSVDLTDADLREVYLRGARLPRANLEGADLSFADLAYADMHRASGWTDDQLREAETLQGATMPDGQKYEDWRKDKEGGKEDGADE